MKKFKEFYKAKVTEEREFEARIRKTLAPYHLGWEDELGYFAYDSKETVWLLSHWCEDNLPSSDEWRLHIESQAFDIVWSHIEMETEGVRDVTVESVMEMQIKFMHDARKHPLTLPLVRRLIEVAKTKPLGERSNYLFQNIYGTFK